MILFDFASGSIMSPLLHNVDRHTLDNVDMIKCNPALLLTLARDRLESKRLCRKTKKWAKSRKLHLSSSVRCTNAQLTCCTMTDAMLCSKSVGAIPCIDR